MLSADATPIATIVAGDGLSPPEIPKIRLPGKPDPDALNGNSSKPLPLRAAANALGEASSEGDSDDKLTPRILEALATLDAETEKLSALPSPREFTPRDDDDEPDWLTEAAEKAATRTPREKQREEANGSSSSSSSDTSNNKTDAAISSSSSSNDPNHRLLATAVATLGHELRCSEEHCRHLRSSAEAQAATVAEVANQLDLTKHAAEATAAAARKIVEDHERDVHLLLAELKRHVSAEAAAAMEKKLSAPQAALQARKRHAAAAAATRKKLAAQQQQEAQENKASNSGGGGGNGFVETVKRSLSFGSRGRGGGAGGAGNAASRGGGVAGSTTRGVGGGVAVDFVPAGAADEYGGATMPPPLVERLAAAASEMGKEVVRRARESSPFRERRPRQ